MNNDSDTKWILPLLKEGDRLRVETSDHGPRYFVNEVEVFPSQPQRDLRRPSRFWEAVKAAVAVLFVIAVVAGALLLAARAAHG